MTTRWDFLKKGDEYFFGAAPAPHDFYVFYKGNECHSAFCRDPGGTNDWYVIFNGLFYKGILPNTLKTTRLSGELTIVEAKKEVEKLCGVV